MNTERLKKFMPVIFENEGSRFTNNPNDAGGATKYGISLRFFDDLPLEFADLDHDGDIDIDDIKLITPEIATPIYRDRFYLPMRIEELKNEKLAIQVFDFGVNAGPRRAIILLQQELRVEPDGIIGRDTLRAANAFGFDTIAISYRYARIAFYKNLVRKNPAKQEFLQGWINRANHCFV